MVALACKWVLADEGAPLAVTPAGHDVAVGRFVDLLDPANAWCAAQVQQLVAAHTQGRQWGVLGQPRTNVVTLNLALDILSK